MGRKERLSSGDQIPGNHLSLDSSRTSEPGRAEIAYRADLWATGLAGAALLVLLSRR